MVRGIPVPRNSQPTRDQQIAKGLTSQSQVPDQQKPLCLTSKSVDEASQHNANKCQWPGTEAFAGQALDFDWLGPWLFAGLAVPSGLVPHRV